MYQVSPWSGAVSTRAVEEVGTMEAITTSLAPVRPITGGGGGVPRMLRGTLEVLDTTQARARVEVGVSETASVPGP